MKSRKYLRFRYLLTRGMTLEILTDRTEIGRMVGQFLFVKHVQKPRGRVKQLKILWNEQMNYYHFTAHDGKTMRARNPTALLPLIDQEARWNALTHLPLNFFPVHSAGLTKNGNVLLILGESGSGKSTVLFDLVKKGWQGLSDELNFLDLRTFRVYPFLRTWSMKGRVPGDFQQKPHVRIFVKWQNQRKVKSLFYFSKNGFKNNDSIKSPCKLRAIFILKTRGAKKPACSRLSEIEVIKALIDNSYVLGFRRSLKSKYRRKYIHLSRKLFKQSHRFERQFKGYQLKTNKASRFSYLIMKQ